MLVRADTSIYYAIQIQIMLSKFRIGYYYNPYITGESIILPNMNLSLFNPNANLCTKI